MAWWAAQPFATPPNPAAAWGQAHAVLSGSVSIAQVDGGRHLYQQLTVRCLERILLQGIEAAVVTSELPGPPARRGSPAAASALLPQRRLQNSPKGLLTTTVLQATVELAQLAALRERSGSAPSSRTTQARAPAWSCPGRALQNRQHLTTIALRQSVRHVSLAFTGRARARRGFFCPGVILSLDGALLPSRSCPSGRCLRLDRRPRAPPPFGASDRKAAPWGWGDQGRRAAAR